MVRRNLFPGASISRRPHKPLSEAQSSSGARLRYAPLSQDASAEKLPRIATEVVDGTPGLKQFPYEAGFNI